MKHLLFALMVILGSCKDKAPKIVDIPPRFPIYVGTPDTLRDSNTIVAYSSGHLEIKDLKPTKAHFSSYSKYKPTDTFTTYSLLGSPGTWIFGDSSVSLGLGIDTSSWYIMSPDSPGHWQISTSPFVFGNEEYKFHSIYGNMDTIKDNNFYWYTIKADSIVISGDTIYLPNRSKYIIIKK